MPKHALATKFSPPKRGKKYFTLEEANRSVTYISRVVMDITDCYRQAVETRQRMEQLHPDDNLEHLKSDYEKLMDRLNELLEELHLVGVELKDFEKGLVDFPAVHQGREIFYCWQAAQAKIESWHEVDTGYGCRQSVETLVR